MFDYEFLLTILMVCLRWFSGYIMATGFAD